jgi:prostaglandin-H2 D-isomerase / glutathione transferase
MIAFAFKYILILLIPSLHKQTMAPSIKLTYFDIEGVAESVRLALALSNTEYEDIRVAFPDWGALKPTLPYGQLPVMTIDDGPMLTQSKALLRHVGATYSSTLYPTNKILPIEEAIGVVEDLQKSFSPAMNPQKALMPDGYFSTDEGKEVIKKLRETFIATDLPKYMKFLAALLKRNDGKWLASTDEPTIADCYALPIVRGFTRGHMDHFPTTVLDDFPEIVDWIKRFCALESVKGRYSNGIF